MKKKVIYFVSFITVCLLCVAIFNKDEVNAEENCTTHYNYYLFQDTSRLDNITKYNSSSNAYETTKSFALGVPDGAKNISGSAINFIDGEVEQLFDNRMSTGFFYNMTTSIMKDSFHKQINVSGNEINSWVYCDDDNNCFSTAKEWFINDELKGAFKENPKTYDEWNKTLSRSFLSKETTFKNIAYDESSNYFYATVSRYWDESTIKMLTAAGAQNDTDIYSIAAFAIKYDLCEEEVVIPPIEGDPVEKSNKVTTHYYIENTTTKLHDDFVENNVAVGTYTSSCPETLKYGNKYYDRLLPSVSVEMKEEGEEELICYYKEQTYSVTINYGEDEDCTTSIRESDYSDGYKAGQSMLLEVPESIGKLTRPTLGTYSSQIVNKPSLDGKYITFTMPAKDVSICVVYTPQTGSSIVKWIALIGLGALAFTVWNISKKNKEINEEV